MPSSLEVWIPWGWLVWLLKTEAKKALRTSVLSSVVLLPTAANKGRKFSSALLLQLMCLWKHFFIFRSSGQIKFLFGFLLSDFLSVSKQHHSIPLELPDPSLKDDKLLCFFFSFSFFLRGSVKMLCSTRLAVFSASTSYGTQGQPVPVP